MNDRTSIEIERKWLVGRAPDIDGLDFVRMRQGYLAVDGDVNVRVREATDLDGVISYRCTIKAGTGAKRTELEWPLDATQFDLAWSSTAGRRIEKRRYRLPLPCGHAAEYDIFDGDLAPLRLVEVEFDSTSEMETFDPPAWFGREVTGVTGYGNASLAMHGAPATSE